MTIGLVQLVEIAFDGTRVKADASRLHTWTAERVEAALGELETRVGQMLSEAEATDAADAMLWGQGQPRELPPELADAKHRQEKLREVLERLREADAARKKDGIKSPAQLPKADTDSTVMPNKEGGYAPNYTPVAAADGVAGYIVDCGVIAGPNEHTELLPSVDRVEENFGRKPGGVAADKAFGTGPNLQGMEQRQVEFYTPVESPSPQQGNPAQREDPRQAVPEVDWPKLPRNDKKKLAKCCFVYDEATDTYCCPMGKTMPYRETKKYDGSQARRPCGSTPARTARAVRWLRSAWTRRPSTAHGDSGWVRALARECTPSCKLRRAGRRTIGGCTSGRRRLRSSRASWRCGGSCCEAWRKYGRSGVGCVPPTT